MSESEHSNMVLLMKTEEKVKELVLLVTDLQKENGELKDEICAMRKSYKEENEDLRQKCESTTKQCMEMEKEMTRMSSVHQQELCDAQNENLYKSQELNALQHLCESKISEIVSLQQALAASKASALPESNDTLMSQQVAFVDSKLQKVQRRLLEVHATCEQVESQSVRQSDLLSLYKQNTRWLLRVLAAAVAQIAGLLTTPKQDKESRSAQPSPPPLTSTPVQEEPLEEEAPRLQTQLECYEKQVEALQKVIQEQTTTIDELKNKQEKPLQLPTLDTSTLFSVRCREK